MRKAVFFNLTQIKMPVGAVASITHRITGILLAIGIPFGVYLLDQSLRDPQSYVGVTQLSQIRLSRSLRSPLSGHWHTIYSPACAIS